MKRTYSFLATVLLTWLAALPALHAADDAVTWIVHYDGAALPDSTWTTVVKAVSIVDHALIGYFRANNLTVPRNYKRGLHGRIEFLADRGVIADRTSLHQLRDARNDMAHEPEAERGWSELSTDLRSINDALKELSLVGDYPSWGVTAIQHAAENSSEPRVAWEQRYEIVIHEKEANDKRIAALGWKTRVMRRGIDA